MTKRVESKRVLRVEPSGSSQLSTPFSLNSSQRRPKGKRLFTVTVQGAGGSVSRSQMRRWFERLKARKS